MRWSGVRKGHSFPSRGVAMRLKVAQHEGQENAARAQARPQFAPAAHGTESRDLAVSLLNLQRTHGNRFVQRLLNGAIIQRKDTYNASPGVTGEPVILSGTGMINSHLTKFLPAAPPPRSEALPLSPGPLAKPGAVDLYITVRSPAKITDSEVFAKTDPPFSGIEFQLARPGKFKQDEYVIGILRWKPHASKLPESEQAEEYATFTHSWSSETKKQPHSPGSPIMLKDVDGHNYGLAIVPGAFCEDAAKKRHPPFDRKTSEW